MSARVLSAAACTVIASALLLTEALSWPQSARFGPLASTTLQCAVRVDAPTSADLAAGLRPGDVILLPQISMAARVAGVFHYTPTQAGRAGDVVRTVVQRGNQRLIIPYTLRHANDLWTFAGQMAFKILLLAISMLVLWRGKDRASLVLGIWCLTVGIALPDAWWGPLPLGGQMFGAIVTALFWTGSPFVLYLVVEAVTTGVSPRTLLFTRSIMVLTIVPALIVNVIDATAQAVTGCELLPVTPWISNTAFVASQLVIIAFFALTYAKTRGLARQRVRWVFWAFLISRAGVLLNLINRIVVHPIHLSGFEWVTVLVFPIGCTYAILRHRIIDVNFVLNRTLVYTILTTLVVGIFILLENILHAAAASRNIGIAVDIIVALGLGFSFNAMHKRVEIAIERTVFRGKHESANTLRRLTEEAPFMESADALLQRAATDVRQASGATGVSIFERAEDGYRLTAASGHAAPPLVDIDDLGFVRLRKNRTCVDLSDVRSAIGSDGFAFAFVVRGALTGALVCARRSNGESYAPDEVALLANVAHELGTELHAIRGRERSDLLDALLDGSLNVNQARSALGTATLS